MLKIQGSVSHPRLVFLHGFLGCALDWDPVIQKLKSRYACISFDLPCPNTIKVILTWLDELALSPYVLVGYSMGGRIALMLERERPDLFSQQILLSAHPGLSSDQERERREREEKIWLEKLSAMPFESFLDDWYAQLGTYFFNFHMFLILFTPMGKPPHFRNHSTIKKIK